MSHIMLDLETFGTTPDAAIVSIGAIRFNIETGKLEDSFYHNITLKSAVRDGGKIDSDTVMWWLGQKDAARNAILSDDSVLIDVALKEFSTWVREKPLEGIWGNGAASDNVWLARAYIRKGWTPAWTYKEDRCYRTMAAMFNDLNREDFREDTEIEHHALHDAATQARHLCAIWKRIRLKL